MIIVVQLASEVMEMRCGTFLERSHGKRKKKWPSIWYQSANIRSFLVERGALLGRYGTTWKVHIGPSMLRWKNLIKKKEIIAFNSHFPEL